MHCLLEGQVSERTEIPIPHGKVTVEVSGANPNYTFFLKNFWKDLGKTVRLRFGNCHLGVLEPLPGSPEPEKSQLDPHWIERMEDFRFYTTKTGRHAVLAKFIGRDTLPHTIRMNRATQKALVNNFMRDLEHLL